MGTYYNPPQNLPKVARRIEGRTYDELTAQLKPGEELFGHYDRYVFQNAVHLYSQSEFDGFERLVTQGVILRLGFYAMPQDVFERNCRD